MGCTGQHGGCTPSASSAWLGGVYEHTCTWEITKKLQHCVPQRVAFAAHERQAKLVLWVVLGEHGFSWFSKNGEAPQCPHRNYFEELMQTFERKEEKKKEKRFICLYMTIWSLVDKYKPTFLFIFFQPILPHRGCAS